MTSCGCGRAFGSHGELKGAWVVLEFTFSKRGLKGRFVVIFFGFFKIGLSMPEVALIPGNKDARILFRYTYLDLSYLITKIK